MCLYIDFFFVSSSSLYIYMLLCTWHSVVYIEIRNENFVLFSTEITDFFKLTKCQAHPSTPVPYYYTFSNVVVDPDASCMRPIGFYMEISFDARAQQHNWVRNFINFYGWTLIFLVVISESVGLLYCRTCNRRINFTLF